MLLLTKHYWSHVFHVFFVNAVLFIPFPYFLFRYQLPVSEFLFSGLIRWLSALKGDAIEHVVLQSDTQSMYWLVAILFVLSLMLAVVFSFSAFLMKRTEIILWYLRKILLYFLILHLAKYGADKIFLNQFYQPEANILFTPLGQLDRDILYWSVIGLSSGYSIFLGVTEVIAAILLCFKKTRSPGLFISAGILINVVAINFGFDISVKLFSLLLLSITVFLLLYRNEKRPIIKHHLPAYLSYAFGWLLFFLLLIEIGYPLFLNKNQASIPFRGAYEVVPDSTSARLNLKKFFIHKDGYIIFQDKQDHFRDEQLLIDTVHHRFTLTDYETKQSQILYDWHERDSMLTLNFIDTQTNAAISGRKIKTERMPALQKGFHWIIDFKD